MSEVTVFLRQRRLEITADVDLRGLQKLRDMLAIYEEILAIVSPPVQDDDTLEWAE